MHEAESRICRACSAGCLRSIRGSSHLERKDVLDDIDVVAVHGFPLDWNHWTIHEWPDKIGEIRAVTEMPIWVSEVGVSTFGAEEVQELGSGATAELLIGCAPRSTGTSLYDLPQAWPATTRHGSGRLLLLPAFLHGPSARGWHAEAGFHTVPTLHAAARAFASGSISRIIASTMPCAAAGSRRHVSSHRPLLGRLFPPQRARLVRSADGSAGQFRRHRHLLLHSGARGSAPHYTAHRSMPEEFAEFCAEMISRYARRSLSAAAE